MELSSSNYNGWNSSLRLVIANFKPFASTTISASRLLILIALICCVIIAAADTASFSASAASSSAPNKFWVVVLIFILLSLIPAFTFSTIASALKPLPAIFAVNVICDWSSPSLATNISDTSPLLFNKFNNYYFLFKFNYNSLNLFIPVFFA